MNRDDRDQHDACDRSRSERGEQTGCQQQTPTELRQAAYDRLQLARTEAHGLEPPSGSSDTEPAEPTEQLLCPVRSQGSADHETDDEETYLHLCALLRSVALTGPSMPKTCLRKQLFP